MPDTGPGAGADAFPVVAPHGHVRVAGVVGERLEMVERAPVLHDGRNPHVVAEQALIRPFHQVVEHVLHAAPAAEVQEATVPNRACRR